MKARLVLTAVLFLLLLTLIFWVWGTDFGTFGVDYLRQIGLLFAAFGLVLIFLQYVFVSRIKFIEAGIGLDRMLRWHRIMGRVGLAGLTVHAVLIVLYRFTVFGELFPTTFIWIGLIALFGFMVTASLASLYKTIGIAYEIWRNIHLLNYVLFPLALVHVFYHTVSGSALFYFWILLAVLYAALIIYRLLRINNIKSNPYDIVEVRQEAKDIWSLDFSGKKVDFKPGQFMFIQLLRNGHLSSSHPFTISNSPTRDRLSITPKKLGDFTSTIKDTKVGDKAFIDAPYGVFSFLNYKHEELVFIAGGIGITPFISMLRYIYDQQLSKQVTLFWTNRDESNLCFREELEQMEEEMENLKVILVMSDHPEWPGEKGRLGGDMIMSYLGSLDRKDFFICGPQALTASLKIELKELEVPPSRIHSELFQL